MKIFSKQILVFVSLGFIVFLIILLNQQPLPSKEVGESREKKPENNLEKIQTKSPAQSPVLEVAKKSAEKILPGNFLIKNVPFISQAPKKIWDDLHREACEEATLIIAKNYLDNNRASEINAQAGDKEIKKMVAWQEENWGGHFDLSLKKVKEMAEKIYGIKSEVADIENSDDIKKIVSAGKLVIAPTAGRELKNPYFQNPGPIYHMVVIFGYDKNNFITHDVGTRRGANYQYDQKILLNAIHNLPREIVIKEELLANSKLIFSSKKSVLVF